MPRPAQAAARGRRRASARFAAVAALTSLVLAAGCTDTSAPPSGTPSGSPTGTTSAAGGTPTADGGALRLGVYGLPDELDAYREAAAAFESTHPGSRVEVLTAPDHAAAMARWGPGADPAQVPDVFLADRTDLPELLRRRRTTPVDALLGERRIDFGDDYYRVGLLAFGTDARLQCMPATVSPRVVYYNPRLVSLGGLGELGDGPASPTNGWSLPQFETAVRRASLGGPTGMYVPPTFDGLLPLLYSADPGFLDDEVHPTSVDLDSANLRDELAPLLRLLRNPQLNLTEEQVDRRGAVRRFVHGRLGLLMGDRSLTPALRAAPGLRFDVMPMPRVNEDATVADVAGYCLSASATDQEAAADLIAYLVGPKGAKPLVRTGYVVPSNVEVVHSQAFAPAGEDPGSPLVFDRAVNTSVLEPITPRWGRMEEAVAAPMDRLMTSPVIDLAALLDRIDALATAALTPPQGRE